jgi:hypothetical protein
MPDDGPPLLALLTCAVFLIGLAWGTSSRRTFNAARDTQAPSTPRLAPGMLTKIFPALLCAFLCGVGAAWLFPWAAILPSMRLPGLLPGVWFLALLSIAAIYALTIRRMDQ